MTENTPDLSPGFLEKLKRQTELLENAVDTGTNLGNGLEADKRRVSAQYQVMGTPVGKKVLNERQKRKKTAKRKAVKAARRINR